MYAILCNKEIETMLRVGQGSHRLMGIIKVIIIEECRQMKKEPLLEPLVMKCRRCGEKFIKYDDQLL